MRGARGCVVPLTQILAPLGIPMRCMPSLLTARPARLQRLALLNSTRLLSAPRLRGACSAASPEEPSSASFMEASVQAVIENIHASPTKAVVVVAGGGSQGLAWLLSVPGASGTVLEALVPYSRPSMLSFLGHEPAKYVSADTARLMALQAYRRALRLSPAGTDVVGVALTAALATATPKRGEHACHVASHSRRGTVSYALTLAKGARDRFNEDRVASRLLVQALGEASGVAADLAGQRVDAAAEEEMQREEALWGDELQALLSRRVGVVELTHGSVSSVGAARPTILLPGSFNPLHPGHTQLLRAALDCVGDGATGGFELSVTNADKGALPLAEIKRRAAQFTRAGDPPLVLTDAPLFAQKAQLLPGTTFVVGVDTALRIVMPKYYGDSERQMRAVLFSIQRAGCSFLVAGRVMDGAFVHAGRVVAPPGLEGLFRSLPDFRLDISSTELRLRADAPT